MGITRQEYPPTSAPPEAPLPVLGRLGGPLLEPAPHARQLRGRDAAADLLAQAAAKVVDGDLELELKQRRRGWREGPQNLSATPPPFSRAQADAQWRPHRRALPPLRRLHLQRGCTVAERRAR